MSGVLPSLIYAKMSPDALYTLESIKELSDEWVSKERLKVSCSLRDVDKCAAALVADGFLQEIHGIKLERMLKTI